MIQGKLEEIKKRTDAGEITNIYEMIPSSRDHHRYTGDKTWYNVNIQIIDTDTALDITRLKERFKELASKRQALRMTMFIPEYKDPVLAVLRKTDNELFYADLREMADGEAAGKNGLSDGQKEYLRTLTQKRLDAGLTEGGPLIHLGYIRVSDRQYVRWMICSHYVLDGTGLYRIVRELESDEAVSADDETVRACYRRLRSVGDPSLSFWKKTLGNIKSLTQLPVTDSFRPSWHAVIRRKWLGHKLGERIRAYCRERRVTMTAFFTAMIGTAMTELCEWKAGSAEDQRKI